MANTSSAKKAVRKNEARTQVNKARRSRVRTFIRKVDSAIAEGNAAQAMEALRAAESEIMRAVTKGVWHKNTAARKVSRLTKKCKSLAA